MPSKKQNEECSATMKAAPSSAKRVSEPVEEGHDLEGGPSIKRRKGLGVRVIGGRIYDSENGKTCHQCRQKTIDLVASCRGNFGSKPCTQHYCAKCLLNRYGEKVPEVLQLPDWSCPRCRGDCNCSICLKKQGRVPTGILAHTAKATGFTSVAELLKKQPAIKEIVAVPLSPTQKSASAKKPGLSKKVNNGSTESPTSREKSETPTKTLARVAQSTKKRKLVVTADGEVEGPVANALLRPFPGKQKKAVTSALGDVSPSSNQKKSMNGTPLNVSGSGGNNKKKNSAKGTMLNGYLLVKTKKEVTFADASETGIVPSNGMQENGENAQALPIKKNKTQKKSSACVSSGDVQNSTENAKVKVETGSETCPDVEGKSLLKKASKKKEKPVTDGNGKLQTSKNCKLEAKEPRKKNQKSMSTAFEEVIVLPQGEPLMMVAGMEFPAEAIAPALQLIEFCSAFKSVLGLRRGDAEAMLRELTKGRLVRKGPNSLLVQLHAKLLNLIEKDFSESSGEVTQSSNGKRSWLNILKKHVSERSCIFLGISKTDSEDGNDPKIDITGGNDCKRALSMASRIIHEKDLKAIKDAIERGAEDYENLAVHHKLQLLIILCDDCLETQAMRDIIESANREYNEALKENREEVLAARKEVRDARQKIKDAEVAKLIASGNIAGPFTKEEQEALLSKVLAETERAIAAASLEKEAISRMKKGRNDAVRTDTIAAGPDGHAFYKLKGVDNMDSVVVQVAEEGSAGLPSSDYWRVYSKLDEDVLTKYLLQRARIARKKMLAEGGLEDFEGDEEKENRMPNSAIVKMESVF